jgi:hypothetical protein
MAHTSNSIFDPSVEFINLDGDDLGPPPDMGPTPIAFSPSTIVNNDFDDEDDLGAPPNITPPSIILPTTTTTTTTNEIETENHVASSTWQCVQTFEVKWDEDDFSGNLKSANEYKVMNMLGSGSFASVYQVNLHPSPRAHHHPHFIYFLF